MPNKLQKLTLLKLKVAAMQHDIHIMEQKPLQQPELPDISRPVHKITHRKKMLSQTAKNINVGRDNFFLKEESRGRQDRERVKNSTQKNLSPVLRELSCNMDNQFYAHSSVVVEKEKYRVAISPQNVGRYDSKERRHYSPNFVFTQSTQPEGKLKTYQTRRTNPLLNPQSSLEKGLKIVNKPQRSPQKILTEHPKSNPNIYFIKNKPLTMPHKKPTPRNKSTLINSPSKGQLMPSKQQSLESHHKTKKHFQRYVHEYYSTHLNSTIR